MAGEWHYSRNGKQLGPVTDAQLKALARSGELLPTDLVWQDGMAEWKPAKSIKGLFPPASTSADATASRPAPPPLPAASSTGALSNVQSHPLVQKILSDKLLLLGCCLGLSILLTFVVPSLMYPSGPPPKTFNGSVDTEAGQEAFDAHMEQSRNYHERSMSSGAAAFAFVLLDLGLLTLIGFVAYRRFYSTAIDKMYDQGGPELPPNYPWTKDERTAPNPKHLWVRVGIGACIAIGVICLLSIVGAIFCLPFFSAAILLYVFGLNRRLFHGRWIPASGKGWVEFLPGHVVKREDGSTGTFALLANQQFIDFLEGGKLVESWKVLSFEHSTHLEVLDMAGKTHSFKRAKIGVYKTSSLFSTARTAHLTGAWQPITEANEWMEFTRDGAIVFSDGSAGKFSVVGEEPNELIEMEMVNGQTRQFKVVSLTPTQLVIAEGNESTTFRRPGKAAKRSDQGAAGGSVGVAAPGGSEGIFGGLFSYFTKWKCPKCGQRAGERTSSKRIGEVQQRVESRPDRNSPSFQYRQVIVNVYDVLESFHCDSCKHEWEIVEERSSQA